MKNTIDAKTVAPMHGHPVDLDRDGDLDGDKDLDLVATSRSGYGQIAWFENSGDPKAA